MIKQLHRSRPAILSLCLLAMALPTSRAFGDQEPAATTPCHLILVIGAPGAPEFGEQFASWAKDWREIANQAGATLSEIAENDAGNSNALERLHLQLADQSAVSTDAQPLWLVFIGHGTFKAGVAKFNLPGPDVAAEELKNWLEPIKRPVVFVNVSAASGPFVNALSGNNRVIVTATRSGEEQNFAHFGAYLPQSLADNRADLDHDDEVSLLEAVLKASADTEDFYASDDRIRTEHAIIDDNGDQRGTPAEMLKSTLRDPGGTAKLDDNAGKVSTKLDGESAAKLIMVPSSSAPKLTLEEGTLRSKIEDELAALRRKKQGLSEDEYYSQLEEKMLELGRIYESAEKRTKMPPSSP